MEKIIEETGKPIHVQQRCAHTHSRIDIHLGRKEITGKETYLKLKAR